MKSKVIHFIPCDRLLTERLKYVISVWNISRAYEVFSDVQENANPSNQGVFARAFTCGGGGKKAVRTQEREKLNVEEGQKTVLRTARIASTSLVKIHSTHHVNKPMWFRPLQTPLGFSGVYIISAFYGFLVFLNEDWFWIWSVFGVFLLKIYTNRNNIEHFHELHFPCGWLGRAMGWVGRWCWVASSAGASYCFGI